MIVIYKYLSKGSRIYTKYLLFHALKVFVLYFYFCFYSFALYVQLPISIVTCFYKISNIVTQISVYIRKFNKLHMYMINPKVIS